MPTSKGLTTFLDAGANVDCDAERLVEFAIMGEAFHRAAHGAPRPTVGLLNVGSEEMKGHEEVREAAQMLREGGFDLAYHGFVEGDDIAKGTVDVVVTDGFTGNIALKTAEGTVKLVIEFFRSAFRHSLLGRIGYIFARGALNRLRGRLDPRKYNGAVFLGLQGIAVKSHGGADALSFANAIAVAVDMKANGFLDKIREELTRLHAHGELPKAQSV